MKPSGVITLTTDFGLEDPYVAMMKGVIFGIHPKARLVDVTHQIPPGDIREGGRVLAETAGFFPEGTVHIGVIDPGVGGPRRAILAVCGSCFLVGPDNGLFWPLLKRAVKPTVIHLTDPAYFRAQATKTFHGRDIFAPVAAHVLRGVDPLAMGRPVTDPIESEPMRPSRSGDALEGEVIRVDHFGNLITNIHENDIAGLADPSECEVRLGSLVISAIKGAYSDVSPGGTLALLGSSGLLEIAVNQGRADGLVAPEEDTVTGMPVRVALKPGLNGRSGHSVEKPPS